MGEVAKKDYLKGDSKLCCLREPLHALINTFILPESPLAINVNDNIVGAARAYLGEGGISYTIIDQVGGEAISLLYSNVYV
ncbi:hypothetical protein GGI20_000700, partial [Coemansia sp. BCRC 34301]